jgi:hypothetical protein
MLNTQVPAPIHQIQAIILGFIASPPPWSATYTNSLRYSKAAETFPLRVLDNVVDIKCCQMKEYEKVENFDALHL